MKIKLLLLAGILSCALTGLSQSRNNSGLFPTIDHSGTLSKRLDYSFYYFGGFNLVNEQINGVDEPANFFVFYAEQALTYKVNPHLSFTGSYVYERQRPLTDDYRNENRFYLQSTYKYDLGRTAIKHRLRFDGRYIENRATGKSPFTSRIRYLFGVSAPLQKTSEKIYFAAYNEFFFNTYKAASAIYGENWAFAGIGLKTARAGNFELGPLYMFWVNQTTELTNFYYLQLAWSTHIDFTRKKQQM